jgi:hypothetical protein
MHLVIAFFEPIKTGIRFLKTRRAELGNGNCVFKTEFSYFIHDPQGIVVGHDAAHLKIANLI